MIHGYFEIKGNDEEGIRLARIERIFGGKLITMVQMEREPDRFIFSMPNGTTRIATTYEVAKRLDKERAEMVRQDLEQKRLQEQIVLAHKFLDLPEKERKRVIDVARRFARMTIWEGNRKKLLKGITVGDLKRIPDAVYSEEYAKEFSKRLKWERSKTG